MLFPFGLEEFLLRNQQVNLRQFPCMLFVAFLLLLLIIFFLSQLDNYVCQCVPPFVNPFWESLCFWTWMTVSCRIGRFPAIISSNIPQVLSFSSPLLGPI